MLNSALYEELVWWLIEWWNSSLSPTAIKWIYFIKRTPSVTYEPREGSALFSNYDTFLYLSGWVYRSGVCVCVVLLLNWLRDRKLLAWCSTSRLSPSHSTTTTDPTLDLHNCNIPHQHFRLPLEYTIKEKCHPRIWFISPKFQSKYAVCTEKYNMIISILYIRLVGFSLCKQAVIVQGELIDPSHIRFLSILKATYVL